MSDHTKGKLLAERIPATFNPKMDGFQLVGVTPGGIDLIPVALCTVNEADEANARRLAAAWNACEGIPTKDLEELPDKGFFHLAINTDKLATDYDSLRAVNAGLLEALENIMQHLGSENHHPDGEWVTEPIHIDEVNAARAAIASARKQENHHG